MRQSHCSLRYVRWHLGELQAHTGGAAEVVLLKVIIPLVLSCGVILKHRSKWVPHEVDIAHVGKRRVIVSHAILGDLASAVQLKKPDGAVQASGPDGN